MTNLKQMRQKRKMTRKQLAEESGIKIGTLKHYEQGTRIVDNMKIDNILVLSGCLDCMPSDIVESSSLRNKLWNLGW